MLTLGTVSTLTELLMNLLLGLCSVMMVIVIIHMIQMLIKDWKKK